MPLFALIAPVCSAYVRPLWLAVIGVEVTESPVALSIVSVVPFAVVALGELSVRPVAVPADIEPAVAVTVAPVETLKLPNVAELLVLL